MTEPTPTERSLLRDLEIVKGQRDALQEQVEALTGRNQFLSTEQVRADIAEARVRELEEQVQALELACDHHRMFWQKAEERERGLKEQLEEAREDATEGLAAAVKLVQREEQLEVLKQAAQEVETLAFRQYVDWMHFHELAMARPFEAESEAQNFARRVSSLLTIALGADTTIEVIGGSNPAMRSDS